MKCFSDIVVRSSIVLIMPVFLMTSLVPSFAKEETRRYVGPAACKGCHKQEYENFIKYARKARSFESIERLKRSLTDEDLRQCYVCHTTGYMKRGGFESPEKTPHLMNLGCEACHGPGELHARTGRKTDIKGKLTKADCEACHADGRIRAFRYKPLIHVGAH